MPLFAGLVVFVVDVELVFVGCDVVVADVDVEFVVFSGTTDGSYGYVTDGIGSKLGAAPFSTQVSSLKEPLNMLLATPIT